MGDQAVGHEAGERLYVPGDSPIHGLPAQVKIAAVVVTVFVVVSTPVGEFAAYAAYLVMVAAVVAVARLPLRVVLPRMVVEVPFLFFALLMPFVALGPRVEVGPLSLAEAGLVAGASMIIKATIGVVLSIVLAATTTTGDMISGLRRLRVPDLIVQILTSMIRYVHVVGAESARMARARRARGFEARGPRSWPVLGRSLGTLFIRSYERGERVHLAMLSRGYTGVMPVLRPAATVRGSQWATGATLPAAAGVILAMAGLS